MAKSAHEIVEDWRNNIPPHTPKEDVEKVVEAFFPGLFTNKEQTPGRKSKGSHWLSVTDPELAWLQDQGVETGTLGGTMSFSHVEGKWVKRVYVDNLLQAITTKQEYAEAKAQAAAEKKQGKRS
jgi:hypothetical protein